MKSSWACAMFAAAGVEASVLVSTCEQDVQVSLKSLQLLQLAVHNESASLLQEREVLKMDNSVERADLQLVHWDTLHNILGSIVGIGLLAWLYRFMVETSSAVETCEESRSYLLDNAKGFAMTMVIFFHLTQLFGDQLIARKGPDANTWLSGTNRLNVWFNTSSEKFNMPVFAFVSGLCSQGPTTPKRILAWFTTIVAPFLLWKLLVKELLYYPMTDLNLSSLRRIGTPLIVFDDWYLLAMAIWRAVTLCFSKCKPKYVVGGMMFASFSASYMDLTVPLAPFAFIRTFKFLPYFAIGYIWPRKLILQARSFSSFDVREGFQLFCMIAIAVVLLMPGNTHIFGSDFIDSHTSLKNYYPDRFLDYTLTWTQIVARVTINVMIMLPVLTFVMPKTETIFTSLGRYSLYPYLLHRMLFHHREKFVSHHPPPVLTSDLAHFFVYVLHYGFCVLVCILMTSKPIRLLFGWAFEPTWLSALLPAECSVTIDPKKEKTLEATGNPPLEATEKS